MYRSDASAASVSASSAISKKSVESSPSSDSSFLPPTRTWISHPSSSLQVMNSSSSAADDGTFRSFSVDPSLVPRSLDIYRSLDVHPGHHEHAFNTHAYDGREVSSDDFSWSILSGKDVSLIPAHSDFSSKGKSYSGADFASTKTFSLSKGHESSIAVSSAPHAVLHGAAPPKCPVFMEPNHYYSTLPADDIRRHIVESCEDLHFDEACEVDMGDFKTKWALPFTTYVQHASSDFWVSIYTDDKNSASAAGVDRFVIEIQRRSGDGHAFCEAVRGLKAKLDLKGVLLAPAQGVKRGGWAAKAQAAIAKRAADCAAHASAIAFRQQEERDGIVYRSVSAPEPPLSATDKLPRAAPVFQPAGSLDQLAAFPCALSPVDAYAAAADSVAHVLALAASPYEDVRCEAARSLADLAAQPLAQRALLVVPSPSASGLPSDSTARDGVAVMIDALDARAVDEHRCAAAALANLLGSARDDTVREARARVHACAGRARLLALVEQSTVPQVLREAGRALVGLGGLVECGDVDASLTAAHQRVVAKLAAHPCRIVKQLAAQLKM